MRSRKFLVTVATAIVATLVVTVTGVLSGTLPAGAGPATDAMVIRWTYLLTGGPDLDTGHPAIAAALERLDESAELYTTGFDPSPANSLMWPDLTVNDEATTSAAAGRLAVLATAYASEGTARHGDPQLRDDLATALRWLYDNRYHEGMAETGNWYHWEIGIPHHLLNAAVLLWLSLPTALQTDLLNAIAYWVPDPTTSKKYPGLVEKGANRVDKAFITVRRGVLADDGTVITQGRDALSQVFDYVSSGDGFYLDGSFIQHGDIAYTGAYGLVLFDSLIRTLYVLSGSPWDVTDPDAANVTAWVYDSYEPVVFRGQVLAGVRGRSIARPESTDHTAAAGFAAMLALYATTAAPADRDRMASMVREWRDTDTHAGGLLSRLGPSRVAFIEDLLAGGAAARGDLSTHFTLSAMDRVVHHRPGYAFAISGRSDRIAAYESGNGENLRGWYTGEGMTYLYDSDLGQYTDGFWATVDPYRLAGTTTATATSYPRTDTGRGFGNYNQPQTWVGGVTLDADTGSFGMHFSAEKDPATSTPNTLNGRKSWFLAGDVVVALGADINATGGIAAQTTIENRLVPAGGTTVTVDGTARSTHGWDADLTGASWLHLSGTGGYVVGSGTTLRGKGEARTGKWSDIGWTEPGSEGQGWTDEVTRDYATIWWEHGTNPAGAGYAYHLLPGADAGTTEAYAAGLLTGNGLRIGDNSGTVQSVHDSATGLTAANFWGCGGTLDTIASQQPSAVAMKQTGTTLELAVSDPTRQQSVMLIEVARKGMSVAAADPSVQVLSLEPRVVLAIDPRGLAGAASRVTLTIDDAATPGLSTHDCDGLRFPVVADSYVRGGSYSGQNFDGQGLIVKKAGGSYDRIGYLRLDLSALAGMTIESAELNLNGYTSDSGGDVTTLGLYDVTDDGWAEETLTYDTSPALGTHLAGLTIDSLPSDWYQVDIMGSASTGPMSLALHGPPSGGSLAVILRDRENSAYAPYLRVRLAQPDLVSNGGFESGSLSPWNKWNTANVVTSPIHSGSFALSLGSAPASVEQVIAVQPSTTYALTGWARVSASGNTVKFGVKNHGSTQQNSALITSTSWTEESLTFTTGPGVTSATIFCYHDSGSGSATCDDITVS